MIPSVFIRSALVSALLCSGAFAEPARRVLAYDLPTPSTVSPELQAVIAKAPPSEPPKAMPDTNAGWNAYSNPDPAKTHAEVHRLLAHFNLSISETTIKGVHCYVIAPKSDFAGPERLLVHLHGGAYTGGMGESGLKEAILVAGATGIKTISVDYRMPPDHPFPTPIDDAIGVWENISETHPSAKLGIFGSSTGGAMVLAVTQRAIKEHLRVPDAVFSGTPWSDLSETGDSYFTNRYADPMPYEGGLSVSAKQYANGMDLKDPRLSPVYGSFSDFPPTLLITGTRDLFLSNTVRVDRKLRDAGRKSDLIVYEGQSHGVYYTGLDYPETQTALKDISRFLLRELGGDPPGEKHERGHPEVTP